ncbi:hypothetical protein DFH06DRAFT_1225375 [Mycena polygramma]|nr:hypothetical protein DFH06DRAFT_1225375 [Mycena polygramma]
MLESDRARVAELQTQILHLERTLAQLRLEHSQAQERIDSYTYPVLTLPNEITSKIFLQVLPPYPEFPPVFGPLSPTLLTHICRQWRVIAIGTPELWSSISYFDNYHKEWKVLMIQLWLERSRGCPLYLNHEEPELSRSYEFMDAITPHRARWGYLKIELELCDFRIFAAPMPLLRHLDLTDSAPPPVPMGPAPLLRTAILDDYCAAVVLILPWAQLTSITLLEAYPSKFVPILTQTPNLVYCELHMYFGNPDDLEFEQDIILNCLESLDLRCIGGVADAEFLPTFVVPALRSLNVQEPYLGPHPIDSLKAFIPTSGRKLQELQITQAKLVPEASYRQAFPSVRTLCISTGW